MAKSIYELWKKAKQSMGGDWLIIIEAWPYSTDEGVVADQKAAGQRVNTFTVQADDMRAAFKSAELIANGIRANPRVWQAPIVSIMKMEYTK